MAKFARPPACSFQKGQDQKPVYQLEWPNIVGLQLSMVSLSYCATLEVIDRLIIDHDGLVVDWGNSLLHHLLVTTCAYFTL